MTQHIGIALEALGQRQIGLIAGDQLHVSHRSRNKLLGRRSPAEGEVPAQQEVHTRLSIPRIRVRLTGATVIRAVLVPALVSLFGRWNWWLPPGRRVCCASSRPNPKCSPEDRGSLARLSASPRVALTVLTRATPP
jgi:hypothetical protein